jgi:hypothetical protein
MLIGPTTSTQRCRLLMRHEAAVLQRQAKIPGLSRAELEVDVASHVTCPRDLLTVTHPRAWPDGRQPLGRTGTDPGDPFPRSRRAGEACTHPLVPCHHHATA